KFIVHGGEKHDVTGHSFVAEVSFHSAMGRPATRVVSCNTTSIVRTLTALKRTGLLKRARGTLLRRATDPWESHLGGIMNTLVPEPDIPSHQGPDAQSVDPELDVITMAVKVPQTLAHLHYWSVQLTRRASKEEVLSAFRASSRIALIRTGDGLAAINTVKELMADLGRPHDNLYEVALWEDMLKVEEDELFYAYMVDNQAIVIPDTIDAIRALTGLATKADYSIRQKNDARGVRGTLSWRGAQRAKSPPTRHFFLEGHPEHLFSGGAQFHASKAGFAPAGPFEWEADWCRMPQTCLFRHTGAQLTPFRVRSTPRGGQWRITGQR
ncbi:MAG TPA: type II glyceraldehyde-3-phosphate dehydrogenase, partial [Phenylobacterium sp.]|nr:type II glyceraldehyde-3-phosphate dehydrogenase [Phenylobacterium sp.]